MMQFGQCDILLISWHTTFDMSFGCHDVTACAILLITWHIFWHVVIVVLGMYFLTWHFGLMTYFWCHEVFWCHNITFISWRIFWYYEVFLRSCDFDVITYFLRHDVFLMSWSTFDVMTYFLMSWHILWLHDILFDIMAYYLTSLLFHVMNYFLMSWRTLWHHDALCDSLTYFVMSWRTFWRHRFFLALWHTRYKFTIWSTFDVMTYWSGHVLLFGVSFWHYDILLDVMTYFFYIIMYIWSNFDVITYLWCHDVFFTYNRMPCIIYIVSPESSDLGFRSICPDGSWLGRPWFEYNSGQNHALSGQLPAQFSLPEHKGGLRQY